MHLHLPLHLPPPGTEFQGYSTDNDDREEIRANQLAQERTLALPPEPT